MMTPGKKSRVLIVEDDPTLRAFWKRVLEDMGSCRYRIVSDSLQAMRLMSERPYELLISDVVMPYVNGYDLAKYASKKHRDIDIILTTGYETDLSRFDLHGCRFHLLHKPYGNVTLIKTLLMHILNGEDVFEDQSEDSFSENDDYPQIIEWKL